MEALGTLALLCNITQLVEQGIALARLYKDVRKTGTSTDNLHLQELMSTAMAIDEERAKLNSPRPLKSVDAQINDIAMQTVAASRKLDKCLRHLRYRDDEGKVPRSSPDTFLKSWRKKSDIADYYKQYERLQQLLQTSLLRNVHMSLVQIRDDQAQDLIKVIETNNCIGKLLESDCQLATSALSALNDFKKSYEKGLQ